MRPIDSSSSSSSTRNAPNSMNHLNHNNTSKVSKQRLKRHNNKSDISGGGGLLAFDRPIVLSLAALLIVYYTVAVVTYTKVSMTETASATNSHHPHEQQQQQQRQQLRSLVQQQQQQQQANGSGSVTAAAAGAAAADAKTSAAAMTVRNNNHAHKMTDTSLDAFHHTGSPEAIAVLQRTFPIHATEMEEIPHPGYYSLSEKPQDWPADLPTSMKVPKFFEDSHGWVYGGSIRQFLGNGQTLPTPEQAAQIGSTSSSSSSSHGDLETIYCSVATYRDPECTGTVEDLYERAEFPDRIRVAILDQRVATGSKDDPICAAVPMNCTADDTRTLCKYGHLIDRYEIDARFAVGPVFARHLGHRFYRGEYFAMQIDSHVRFIEHWDSDIVQQWKSARNEMGILTTYLSDIQGSIDPVTHQSTHPVRPIMCQSDYEGQNQYRHLRHGQQPEGIPGIRGQPTLHPFWAAGFSFARGHFVIQVPYDQYLPMVFQGEEISLGLRGFTYGYDYYTPERGVCFHMYAIKENEAKRKKVPLFWEHANMYSGLGMKSMKRLNSIIGMENFPEEQWVQDERDKYGLGQIRTTQKFFDTFGIHTETHTVEKHLCRFVGKPMMKVFLPALRSNGMGLDYDKITYKFVDPDTNNANTDQKRLQAGLQPAQKQQ